MWNVGDALAREFEAGDFVLVDGKVQLFQGALQMILSHVERVETEKVDLTDFLPHTEHDVSKLLERLRGTLRRLGNPHLRALAEAFLMDDAFMRGFCHAPAGVRNHHAYVGGLLEHVVTLLDAAERILPLYPELDRDLLLTGVFLHDIGKVRELSFTRTFSWTPRSTVSSSSEVPTTTPWRPPFVTMRSPFWIVFSISSCSRCFFCWGRISSR